VTKRARFRPLRLLGFLACVPLGLALGFVVFLLLVSVGAVRNPFAPSLGGDVALAASDRPGVRVLFVGNSLTSENSMPALVRRLAEADHGARPIFAVQYVAPGWTLSEAARDRTLDGLLTRRWDFVVLQEQSQVPTLPRAQLREFFPAARSLHRRIRAAGSRTVLFMTWGWEHGDSANYDDDSYAAMQSRLADSYRAAGAQLPAHVAPVGLAWAEALRRDPGLDLWARDGFHPSRLGSYLAACVFYRSLTGRDPRRSSFTAGLDGREARFLQDVAADVVTMRAA
jgi:hypothetical protein